MSATRNDITGDVIASKVRGAEDMRAYQSGWDRIFGARTTELDTDAGWSDIVDRVPPTGTNTDGESHD